MSPLVTVDARLLHMSGGIGVYLGNILPLLIKHSGWRFALLGDPKYLSKYEWAAASNVSLIPLPERIYSLAQQFWLPKAVPRDSVLFWAPHYDIAPAVSGPMLVTVHDLAHLALPEVFSGIMKQTYSKLMMQAVRIRANGIVFISKFTQAEFHRIIGIPRGYTTVVHNGVADAWRNPVWRAMPSALTKPYIVYVGNVKPHKNIRRRHRHFNQTFGRNLRQSADGSSRIVHLSENGSMPSADWTYKKNVQSDCV